MKIKFLLLLILLSVKSYSQTYVFGNIINDSQVELSGVLIVNTNTEEQTFSDKNGHFMIKVSDGDWLRFVRQNYERVSIKIKSENFRVPLKLQMTYNPQDIETVELKYKVTGNLKEDSKHFGAPKKDVALNIDLGKDRQKYSSPEVLKPKPGEFKQPKGKGFETSKIGYKWEKIDLQLYLEEILTKDYFKSMGLQEYEIFPFINYTLKNFEIKSILRFGRVNSTDLARFQAEAENQLESFKEKYRKK